MSMLRALAAVGGAAALGYQQGADEKRRREQQDEDRAWQTEQRARQRKDWAEADAEKERLAAASQDVKPTEVKADKPDTMDNRDVGQAGEAPLPTAGYDVQGQRYAGRAEAEAAAGKENTEEGRSTRMARALEARSPERAAQLRAATRQGKAADLSIAEATQRQADAKWERDLGGVTTPDELASLLSASHGDMEQGKVQLKAVPNADGKTFDIHRVGDNGQTFPSGNKFASLDEARMLLSRRVTPEQRLAHYEGIRRYEEQLKLAKQTQDRADKAEERRAGHERRMEGLMSQRINGAAPQALTPDATFDLKTATAEAQARIKAIRDERAAAGKPMTAQEEAVELQNTIAAYKQVHTQRFVQGAITSALTRAKADPQAYAAEYRVALAGGATPDVLAGMGFPAPGGALPGVPGAAPVAPQAASPGPVIAPAAPQSRMAEVAAADPLKGLSRQQIREKKVQLQEERARWAGNPNAGALLGEIDTLLQRIDNGQY